MDFVHEQFRPIQNHAGGHVSGRCRLLGGLGCQSSRFPFARRFGPPAFSSQGSCIVCVCGYGAIGSIVVPFCGLYLGSKQVVLKGTTMEPLGSRALEEIESQQVLSRFTPNPDPKVQKNKRQAKTFQNLGT